jgi:DNA polymerase V
MTDSAILLPPEAHQQLAGLIGARAFVPETSTDAPAIPLYAEPVPAGFPSPAQGHEEARLDLNRLVIRNPVATFFLVAEGLSMIDANIRHGDILVVDKSVQPIHGHIVIAEIDGRFTVKYLSHRDGRVRLVPANKSYPAIELGEGETLTIFGVVLWILHRAPH